MTAYFPYSDAFGLTMSAIPLNPGPYDVNTNDLVWQRDKVHAAHTQAMFLKMQHALTRVKIRLSGRQPSKQVGDVVDGGVVYWVNPDDANDFRVVALDQPELMWSASCSYDLNANARNETARNGAEIMTLAKNYSDSHTGGATGDFETDFPAFSYCYEKTDGGVSKGTWYLPSKQEMMDLYSAKDRVESVISVQNGTAFMATDYWAATEISAAGAWNVSLDDGHTDSDQKNAEYVLRCVRGPLASEGSDLGGYTGAGKITGVRIADAGDVASDDRVVYLDGTLDLTQATPVVTPGWPDAVADMSEKTLTAEGVLYDLLLLPVDKINAGKVMLEVELDGKVLSVPFPVDAVDKWEAGKAYTYEVSIRNGEAQVVFGKATVTPWNYGGSISGDLDTSKPEYGGGDVQDWGGNDWETEEGGDEPVTGEVTAASLVSAPADNVIPAEGGEYSVRLTGNWTGSVPVRMSVGGNAGGLLHAVCSDGAATVTFVVPASASHNSRTVTFEYLWNGTWTKIGSDCTQAEYYVITDKTVTPEGDIPGLGGTYSVKLTGILPVAGVEVRAQSGGTTLVTGTVIASGTPIEMSIPANRQGAARTVIFEYNWNSEWTMIGNARWQENTRIGEVYGGGVIYWVNPEDDNDFRVMALDMATGMRWADNPVMILGAGARDNSKRNGADVWIIAKRYSDNKNNGASGHFATDFPAFSYCYEKTDGNVPKGTWYLPSSLEVLDLLDARETINTICREPGFTKWQKEVIWSALESTDWPNAAYARSPNGWLERDKNGMNWVRCVRRGDER